MGNQKDIKLSLIRDDDIAAVIFHGGGPGRTYFNVLLTHGANLEIFPDWKFYDYIAERFHLGYSYPNDPKDKTKGFGDYYIKYSEIATVEYFQSASASSIEFLGVTLKSGAYFEIVRYYSVAGYFDDLCDLFGIVRNCGD